MINEGLNAWRRSTTSDIYGMDQFQIAWVEWFEKRHHVASSEILRHLESPSRTIPPSSANWRKVSPLLTSTDPRTGCSTTSLPTFVGQLIRLFRKLNPRQLWHRRSDGDEGVPLRLR